MENVIKKTSLSSGTEQRACTAHCSRGSFRPWRKAHRVPAIALITLSENKDSEHFVG